MTTLWIKKYDETGKNVCERIYFEKIYNILEGTKITLVKKLADLTFLLHFLKKSNTKDFKEQIWGNIYGWN